MANYTGHAIMSDLLYDRLKKNNKFKVDINKNSLKLFSLGQDLTCLNKPFFNYTHLYDSKKFFTTTIKYIYDNKLQYNSDAMAYLYGHIAHYCLDVNMHTFVKKIVSDVNKESILKPHTIVECDMDKYLINKYGNDSSFFDTKYVNPVKDMINYTYRNVYGYYGYINVSSVYRNSIRFIKYANKGLLFMYKNNIINIATKKEKYINDINFYNYVNGDMGEMFDKIINSSIKKVEKTINFVNRYLYRSPKDFYLNYVFDDTPYDVGLEINTDYDLNPVPIYSRIQIK